MSKIDKKFLSSITTSCDLAKSIDKDQRLITAVVLRPEVVDSQGDIYSFDVVKKACHDYVAFCMNGNVQHTLDVTKSDMVTVECYIAPADMTFENGDVIKGDWIMTNRIDNDELWKATKAGTFTGFSVGCSALTEVLDES
jgi:hypothetical protein